MSIDSIDRFEDNVEFSWLLRSWWNQRGKALFCVVFITTVVVVASVFQFNTFSSQSQVILPDTGDEGGRLRQLASAMMPGILSDTGGTTPEYYLEMLKSRRIALKIIKRFDLMQRYEIENIDKAIKVFRGKVSFNKVQDANIVKISYTEAATKRFAVIRQFFDEGIKEDAQRAASFSRDVVAAIIEEFNKLVLSLGVTSAERERDFLAKRVDKARGDLDLAEQRLADYKKKRGALAPKPQARATLQTVASLQGRLIDLRASLEATKSVFDVGHPKVLKLKAEIDAIEGQMSKLVNEKGAKESALLGRNTAAVLMPIYMLPTVEREYAKLLREATVQATLYTALLSQYEQAKIAAVRDVAPLKVLDPPNVPQVKSGPKRALQCILGAFLAVFLSFGWAVIAQLRSEGYFDDIFKEPEDGRSEQ